MPDLCLLKLQPAVDWANQLEFQKVHVQINKTNKRLFYGFITI